MKRIVLGTAGHIDHGKTLLTKALTGVNTDRLAEEQARGITIELGFAPLRLSDGTQISLVDVPGHEKFVRTMMTGVSGVDGILLVVAADDGVMPQTREHLDILCLLGVRRGILVLTKTDLVDETRLAAVNAELHALVEGTFLENAPVCPVSALTGFGIDHLKEEIELLVQNAPERSCERPFRLASDRAFSAEGFGTVVTGTVTEGAVRVGSSVELYPAGVRGTVRTLQTHGEARGEALAGMRAAMSFSGLSRQDAERGCTVCEPGSVRMTDLLTVRLQILSDCPYPIRNASQLHLFHGAGEQVCKLRLLDADALRAGQSGFAQLKLTRPIPVRYEDRFILRFYSPVLTVGGGEILACGGNRLRRNHPQTLERLSRLSAPELSVRLLQRVTDCALTGAERGTLQKSSNLSPKEYASCETALLESGMLLELLPGHLLARQPVEEKRAEAVRLLADFHESYPLQPGMRLAEWRSRLFSDEPTDALLALWTQEGRLRTENGYVALPDFSPVFTREHKIMQRKLLHYYREAWFFAPDLTQVREKFRRFGTLFEQVLTNLRVGGQLIALTPRYWVHFEAYREALGIFSELAAGAKPVTLAQLRTAAGISRKYSQMFLEYWDRHGITRRVGDAHILLRDVQEERGQK